MVSTVVSKVEASNASAIYGSMAGQEIQAEIDAGSDVADTLASLFSANYYYVINDYGSTTKQSLLANIAYTESNYDAVAVFYYGHMAGDDNYWCCDANVTYGDIQSYSTGKTIFAWSWVCKSAGNLPSAWTDDQIDDGYHCYIGFSGASPTLSYESFNTSTALGMDFIMDFYSALMNSGYSVHDSLDSASYAQFATCYTNSPLACGYLTHWLQDMGACMSLAIHTSV
jgi:hypothetical protein